MRKGGKGVERARKGRKDGVMALGRGKNAPEYDDHWPPGRIAVS